MIRKVTFTDQASADAWVWANNLRRTSLPASPQSFYLVDSGGEIVGQWCPVDRIIQWTQVVEVAWFDTRKVNPPRELVN